MTDSLPDPTPIDFLAYRAKRNGSDLAVVSQGRLLTYSELYIAVRGVAGKLRKMGVEPGQMAAIYHRNPLINLILLLACFHEGVTCCSAHPNLDPMPSGMTVDVYLTEQIAPFMSEKPTIVIDGDWVREGARLMEAIAPRAYPSPDSYVIAVTSSGTTGEPKAVPFTMSAIDQRIKNGVTLATPTGPNLCMMTLATFGGLITALRSIYSGTPNYLVYNSEGVVRAMAAGGVTSLVASPSQYGGIIKHLMGRSVLFPHLQTVTTGGAALPQSLLIGLQAKLCSNVVGAYGSTEAGATTRAPAHILYRYPGAAGYVEPGSEVQLVDDHEQPVPIGAEGIVRIRTTEMASEYLGDPAATAVAFRDGWFYPGDLGQFVEDEILLITGREVEVINMGGSKMNPVLIDDFLSAVPGVNDAAAFGADIGGGNLQIWAAVVAPQPINEELLLSAARDKFGAKAPSRIFQVDEIPRNQMGKIQRLDLQAQMLKAHAANA